MRRRSGVQVQVQDEDEEEEKEKEEKRGMQCILLREILRVLRALRGKKNSQEQETSSSLSQHLRQPLRNHPIPNLVRMTSIRSNIKNRLFLEQSTV